MKTSQWRRALENRCVFSASLKRRYATSLFINLFSKSRQVDNYGGATRHNQCSKSAICLGLWRHALNDITANDEKKLQNYTK